MPYLSPLAAPMHIARTPMHLPAPRHPSRSLLAAAAFAAAACGSTTEPVPPAAVIVTPAADTLLPGAELQLVARVVNVLGDTVAAEGVLWSSSAPDIVSVTPDGRVTAAVFGSATITALVSNERASALIRVQRPFSARMVAVGPATVCAIDLTNQVWCFGDNSNGELGLGNTGLPHPTFTAPVGGGHRFATVGVGDRSVCSLDLTGRPWCWGTADNLGLGVAPTSSSVPVLADTVRTYDTLAVGIQSCGLIAGTTWCWGGSFGSNSAPRNYHVNGQLFTTITAGFSASCGIDAEGVATCWHGDNLDYFAYLPFTGSLAQIAIGSGFRCALYSSGAAVCEGRNNAGQLGNSTTTDATTPTPLPGTWKQLAAGDVSACGLAPDGVAWCWGGNDAGQLGTGDSTASLVPVVVATPARFRSIATAATPLWDFRAAVRRTCGVTSADELLCWGAGLPARPAVVGY